jgi:hypothetical protein
VVGVVFDAQEHHDREQQRGDGVHVDHGCETQRRCIRGFREFAEHQHGDGGEHGFDQSAATVKDAEEATLLARVREHVHGLDQR